MRLVIILIAVILLMGGGLTWLYTQYTTVKQEKKQAIALVLSTEKSLKTYKNSLGAATARIGVLELSVRNAEDLAESERLKFARQFKGVKKNLKNVEVVDRVNLDLTKEWELKTSILTDTTKFTVSDGFNTITVTPGGDSTRLSTHSIVELEGAVLWSRKWLLGKKTWSRDISCKNPNVVITGLEYIRIGKK